MPRHTMLSTTREASIDVQELQTLYQEKFTLIYRYVLSKVGNRYQIARTTLADYWRAYYRESTSSLDELLEAGWEVPAEELSNPMSSVPAYRVQRLLQALPEHYREVLTCRFLLNLSVKATALRMGRSVANVKVLQFRALKRAACLEHIIAEAM